MPLGYDPQAQSQNEYDYWSAHGNVAGLKSWEKWMEANQVQQDQTTDETAPREFPKQNVSGSTSPSQQKDEIDWGSVPFDPFGEIPGDNKFNLNRGIVNLGVKMIKEAGSAVKNAMDTAAAGPQPTETDPSGGGLLAGYTFEVAKQFGMQGMALAPKEAAGIFGGRLSQTAPLADMEMAGTMYKRGFHPDQIHAATGIDVTPSMNPDLKQLTGTYDTLRARFKYEIDDSGSKWITPPRWEGELKKGKYEARTVGDMFDHPELFKAYPELKNIELMMDINPKYKVGEGGFGTTMGGTQPWRPVIRIKAGDGETARAVILHELQHAVQRQEGFARGGSPKDFVVYGDKGAKEMYARQAGEVEARNVQSRMNMTKEQRANYPPWYSEDVARDNWLWGDIAPFDNPWGLRPIGDVRYQKAVPQLPK